MKNKDIAITYDEICESQMIEHDQVFVFMEDYKTKIKELESKLAESGVCESLYNLKIKNLEGKLKITTKALNKIYDDDRSMEDMERTANRALSEVEDYEEAEMVKE